MRRCIEGSLAEGGRIVDDPWTPIETLEGLHAASDEASVLVRLPVWIAARDALLARTAPVGIAFAGDEEPATVADDLARVAIVAIDFPKFTDGRGYSLARLLRERHGYRGKLRATGDVLRDQLFYLLRCGFDSFAMRHDDRLDDALTAFRDFSDAYQTSVEQPRPWFARRSLAPAS